MGKDLSAKLVILQSQRANYIYEHLKHEYSIAIDGNSSIDTLKTFFVKVTAAESTLTELGAPSSNWPFDKCRSELLKFKELLPLHRKELALSGHFDAMNQLMKLVASIDVVDSPHSLVPMNPALIPSKVAIPLMASDVRVELSHASVTSKEDRAGCEPFDDGKAGLEPPEDVNQITGCGCVLM